MKKEAKIVLQIDRCFKNNFSIYWNNKSMLAQICMLCISLIKTTKCRTYIRPNLYTMTLDIVCIWIYILLWFQEIFHMSILKRPKVSKISLKSCVWENSNATSKLFWGSIHSVLSFFPTSVWRCCRIIGRVVWSQLIYGNADKPGGR